MALTRKFLAALGIEAEKIDEIIEAHTDTVTALKKERDTYKQDAEKLPEVQKELDDLKEAAEKNKNNPYKAQYEDLKTEYDKYKQDMEAEKKASKQRDAYRALLVKAGISEKRLDSILKVSDTSVIDFDDKGEVKDADKHLENCKKEWADFIVTKKQEGAETPTPPAGEGGGNAKSRAAEVATKFYKTMYGGGKKE